MEKISIDSLINKEIQSILSMISAPNLKLYLVGGVVRDYIFYKTVSSDLDIEVHFNGSERDFEKIFDELFVKLQGQYVLEKLSYLVYRISHKNLYFTLELSCPRVEIIKTNADGVYSHHYFDAKLDPRLSIIESFKRRDFSINAIGIELDANFETGEISDLFAGRDSFQQKELRQVSDDFIFDPVRYLRAFRFSERFEFKMSAELTESLSKMKLNELSLYYFLSEWKKSFDPSFGKRILAEMKHNVPFVPKWLNNLDHVLSVSSAGKNVREVLIFGALKCENAQFNEFKKLNLDQFLTAKDLNAIAVLREHKWFSDYQNHFKNISERFEKDQVLLSDLRELKRYTEAYEVLKKELDQAEFICASACEWFNQHANKSVEAKDQVARGLLLPEWRAFFWFSKIKD